MVHVLSGHCCTNIQDAELAHVLNTNFTFCSTRPPEPPSRGFLVNAAVRGCCGILEFVCIVILVNNHGLLLGYTPIRINSSMIPDLRPWVSASMPLCFSFRQTTKRSCSCSQDGLFVFHQGQQIIVKHPPSLFPSLIFLAPLDSL
jgi:hypothetical protein